MKNMDSPRYNRSVQKQQEQEQEQRLWHLCIFISVDILLEPVDHEGNVVMFANLISNTINS